MIPAVYITGNMMEVHQGSLRSRQSVLKGIEIVSLSARLIDESVQKIFSGYEGACVKRVVRSLSKNCCHRWCPLGGGQVAAMRLCLL